MSSLHIPLRTGQPGHRQITGHEVSIEVEFTGKHIAYPTWTASFPPSEEIIAIIPRNVQEPVASLGKVLGDRSTLYKYLNPHLFAVLTGSATRCAVYLIDGAKGTIIYHETLPTTGGSCDVHVVLTENWLVYHYYDGHATGANDAKSYRMVSVELYEGVGADDKTYRFGSFSRVSCLDAEAANNAAQI